MKSPLEMKDEEIVEVVRGFLKDIVMSLGELMCNHNLEGAFVLHPKTHAALKKSCLKNFIDQAGIHGQVEETLGGLPYELDESAKEPIYLVVVPSGEDGKVKVD